MSAPQMIQTPTGERLVVLPEQEYNALLARLEDQDDIDAANAVVARGEESFPVAVVDALLEGVAPVKVYREYRGLRAGELATKAGISQGYLSEIEAGKKTGSLSVLTRIAGALDVELSDLT
ncbi:DNA-binding transcriptional regulator, XRE-family HTH domain [Vreelandella subterranea]|uniref:DNA-binding transcriptional regulator, XRE-family HTH domain n=1 Tax=Vreelandella subterranea TaxID=416874 RepID=A0A1H9UJE9_9GAMM|nr:helix-turn-helix transcriptional regulator [Halomonas subterranea]SES09418.1 DNA-binding transcriptional regulator, XRE-family HTH domain [Halomonas subterranea]